MRARDNFTLALTPFRCPRLQRPGKAVGGTDCIAGQFGNQQSAKTPGAGGGLGVGAQMDLALRVVQVRQAECALHGLKQLEAPALSPAQVVPDPHRLFHAAKFAGYPRIAKARSPMHRSLQPIASYRPERIPDA